MKRLFLTLGSLLLVLMCTPAMWGTAIASLAGSSLNWNSTGTWNGGVIPGSGDTVTIITGSSVIVTDSRAASTIVTAGTGNVDVQNGGTLTITTTAGLVGTGNYTVETGGAFVVGTVLTVGSGTTLHGNGGNITYGDGSTAANQLLLTGTLRMDGGVLISKNNALISRPGAYSFYGATLYAMPNGGGAGSQNLVWAMNNTGGGDVVATFCLDSTCTDASATSAWPTQVFGCNATTNGMTVAGIACSSSSTGGFGFNSGGGALAWHLNVHHSRWDYCGLAATQCVAWGNSALTGPAAINISGMLLSNSGTFNTAPTNNTPLVQIDGMTVLSPLTSTAAIFQSTTGWAAGSYLTNFTMAQSPTSNPIRPLVQLTQTNFAGNGSCIRCGDASNVPSVNVWNGAIQTVGQTIGHGVTVKNSLGIINTGGQAAARATHSGYPNTHMVLEMAASLSHWPDGTNYQYNLTPQADVDNVYKFLMADGDGVIGGGDRGNTWWDAGHASVDHSISFNSTGEFDWGTNGASQLSTMTNNTWYQGVTAFGDHVGSSGTSALVSFNGNLITSGQSYTSGLNIDTGGWNSGDTTPTEQLCTNCIDYNGFHGMQGSGDANALPHVPVGYYMYPNPALGTGNGTGGSYMEVGQINYRTVTAITITPGVTNDTISACTSSAGTCFSTTIAPGGVAGSIIKNSTRQQFVPILSVTSTGPTCSPTCATIAGHVPGSWLAGDSYIIANGPLANQTYGVTAGAGTHDVHAPPQYFDPGRNMCTWNFSLGGTGIGGLLSNCYQTLGLISATGTGWRSASNIWSATTATTGGPTYTVTCALCTFVTWGVQPGDYIESFNATPTWNGFSQVATVIDETHLTTVSDLGVATTIQITLVTNTISLGNRMLAMSGWNYNIACTGSGCTGTIQAVTPTKGYTAADLYEYLARGFTPYQGQFCNTYNNTTVGAVPCFPPAIISSN